MNLVELLHASARRHPDRPAVTEVRSGHSLTYADLLRETERVEAFLLGQGVQRGQRIGLLAPNGTAYLPAAFGLLGTGACLVPIASNLTPAEVARIASEIELNGCLASPKTDALPGSAHHAGLSGGECDGFTFQWIARDVEGPAALRRLDPAFIRFTSGTTADSKGIVLSHDATVSRVEAADRVLGFTAD